VLVYLGIESAPASLRRERIETFGDLVEKFGLPGAPASLRRERIETTLKV